LKAVAVHRRPGPGALRDAPSLAADVAWIAGGLYGNVEALDAIERRVANEARGAARARVRLVFNGDFHWFDTDPADFARIRDGVARHTATAGNVEAELAAPDAGAGCGCAYPDFVDGATVERSNRLIEALRATARGIDGAVGHLAGLRRLLRLDISGTTIGVIHGDPEALAGWALAIEHVAGPGASTNAARVRAWAERAGVDAFACAHTCLPWAAAFDGVPVINNGSAGMPNFCGRPDEVLVTRIAPADAPAPDAAYAVVAGGLRLEALPVPIDGDAWRARFAAAWPPGSAAHDSYAQRLRDGPAHTPAEARPAVRGPRPSG
jgi:hypothetical protein